LTTPTLAATELEERLGIIIGTAKDWDITLTSESTGTALVLGATDKIVFTAARAKGGVVFTRENTAAGGSDAEIAIVDGAIGKIRVKAVEANTAALPGTETLKIECRYKLASEAKDRVAFVGELYCEKGIGAAIP
jgi:hypothetical protein